MGIGRKGGRPDRSGSGSEHGEYGSCSGGCGRQVAVDDSICSNCRVKMSGFTNGTAGTGKDSCAEPIFPDNKDVSR